jgi:hypothetical protein
MTLLWCAAARSDSGDLNKNERYWLDRTSTFRHDGSDGPDAYQGTLFPEQSNLRSESDLPRNNPTQSVATDPVIPSSTQFPQLTGFPLWK